MTTSSSNKTPAWLVAILLAALGLAAGTAVIPSGGGGTTTTTSAATTTAAPPTTGATSSTSTVTTTTVDPSTLAVWRQPISAFGVHPRSAEFAARCYAYCSTDGPGKVSTYFDAYSVPTYDIRDATTTIKVFKASPPASFDGSVARGGTIPWNLNLWHPGTGNDLIMVLVNPGAATTVQGIAVPAGAELDLWQVFLPGSNQTPCLNWDNLGAGLVLGSTFLCAGGADWIQDAAGHKVDWRTATTTYPTGGGWFSQEGMLLRPDDFTGPAITHALDISVYNTMFGPACSTGDRADPTKAGQTCGFYENPASNLEWGGTTRPNQTQACGSATMPFTNAQRSKTIPEGARLYLAMSGPQITTWLDSRSFTGALRTTMQKYATALVDYGAIVTNTTCAQAGIRTTGRQGPDAPKWATLGIPTDPTAAEHLLDGLFTSSNIRVAAPSAPVVVGSNHAG